MYKKKPEPSSVSSFRLITSAGSFHLVELAEFWPGSSSSLGFIFLDSNYIDRIKATFKAGEDKRALPYRRSVNGYFYFATFSFSQDIGWPQVRAAQGLPPRPFRGAPDERSCQRGRPTHLFPGSNVSQTWPEAPGTFRNWGWQQQKRKEKK